MRAALVVGLVAGVVITAPALAARKKISPVNQGWVQCAIARFSHGPIIKRWNAQRGWMECRVATPKPKPKK